MTTASQPKDENRFHIALTIVRVTLGVILLSAWSENLGNGIYTGDGIRNLFVYIFDQTGGGAEWYRSIINSTVLAAPGVFASFQLVAELLLGLGLTFGGLTRLAGIGATVFFFNLLLAYFGGSEWIWTYVLLTAASLAVALTPAGRRWGLDRFIVARFGEPPTQFLW